MNTSLTEVKIDELFDLNLNISYIDLESFESTVLYQSAFLAFLRLNSYIDKEVDDKINKLYEDLKTNEFISSCIEKLKNNSKCMAMCKDDSFVFLILFSFDYFEKFYKCLCELIKTGSILEENKNDFLSCINC